MVSLVSLPSSEFTSNWIANEPVTSNASTWSLVKNPATGDILTRVPRSTQTELQWTVQTADMAYSHGWAATPKWDRRDKLFTLAMLVKSHEDAIATTIAMETGKTLPDAKSEVKRGIDMIQSAATVADRAGERAEMRASMQIFTDRHPLGVCLTVTPFNLPFLIPLWTIPFAIALGNTVVLKPSEQCPTAAMWIPLLMREAGFPPGVLNVVHGDGVIVQQLIAMDAIKAVSFVGGDEAGHSVWDMCRQMRKKVQANVSGKNHLVVMNDSPRDFTVNALVQSCFGSAGQRCTSPRVAVLVGEADKFLDDFVIAAQKLIVGEPQKPNVDFGPVISAAAKQKIIEQVQTAVSEGATLCLDGTNYTEAEYPGGNWIGPTILANILPRMKCYQEEIFGPVLLCVYVDSLEDAIHLINSNNYGNGCSIFTSSGAHARQFQRDTNVGIVNINHPQTAPQAAFSFTSNKASFLGESNFYGQDAVNFFTYTKTVTSLWHHPDQQSMARMRSEAPSGQSR